MNGIWALYENRMLHLKWYDGAVALRQSKNDRVIRKGLPGCCFHQHYFRKKEEILKE